MKNWFRVQCPVLKHVSGKYIFCAHTAEIFGTRLFLK
jgi:hypothetical protein